jgi:hypothetical protein
MWKRQRLLKQEQDVLARGLRSAEQQCNGVVLDAFVVDEIAEIGVVVGT